MTGHDDNESGGEGKASAAAWSVDELRAWKATLIPFREAIDRIAQARGIGGEAAIEWLRLAIRRGQVQPIVATFWASGFTLDRSKLPPEWGVPAIAFVENGDRVERVDGLAVDLRQALFDPDQIRAAAREAQKPASQKVREPKKKDLWPDVLGRCAARLTVYGDSKPDMVSVIERWIIELVEGAGGKVVESTARRYASAMLEAYREEQVDLVSERGR